MPSSDPATPSSTPPRHGPLQDIRVLDLATVIAGPGAARYLADHGADVLKIERPGTGDSTRGMGMPDPADGTSLYWKLVSRNKRCATLDLKSDEGRATLLDLVADAHVLIENFRPGTLEGWGMSYDELAKDNPGLIMLRISGYGQTGPYRDLPGFGAIGEAMGGLRHLTGEPGRVPVRCGISIGDTLAALQGQTRRKIVLRKVERLVVIEDTLSMAGTHDIELLFHCSERCQVDVVTGGFAVTQGQKTLLLRLPGLKSSSAQVTVGGTAPIFGWVSRHFDHKLPAPTIVWKARLTGDVVLQTQIIC